jgi:Kae1-associated kinase Bud32
MSKEILAQGAEAIITLEKENVIKKRIKKSYRIKALDEKIRKLRTRGEAKIIERVRKITFAPKVIKSSEKEKIIEMEYIPGEKISEFLNDYEKEKQFEIMKKIGIAVKKIHKNDIIHGDLTTSNMILHNNEIYLIDFGLGFNSKKIEDKAVDIHLLKQALEAKHFANWKELYQKFKLGYSEKNHESKKVFERLLAVEKRGRYKH